MSGRPPSPSYHRGPGERAAALAASYCTRRLGRAHAQAAWQILADGTRLGVIRHGRPEAWAAGVIASLTIAGPVVYYLLGGEQAKAKLDEMKNWLALHNNAIMAVLFLVFGAKLIADGLPPLT